MEFEDIVTLKKRTDEVLGVMYDSRLRDIPSKGLRVPRHYAELGIKQHAFRWSSQTGAVEDSKVYIEEDLGTALETPHEKLDLKEVNKIKQTDGLGEDTIIVNGKVVAKKTIDLKPAKESFATV